MYKFLDKIDSPSDLKRLDNSNLENLCLEIRDFIIENVNNTGGHLGSSLGAVEICVALHKVFDAPNDKIIFDIGHQAYAHKILTKRKNKFPTLRQKDGLHSFSYPKESIYDEFIGGHSSTSISTALGVKKALLLKGDSSTSVISVIGDASIGAGMALEAINDMGYSKCKVIIILNDNNMSISKTEGALGKHFSKLRTSNPLQGFVKKSEDLVKKLPDSLIEVAKNARNKFTNLISNKHGAVFEELGFTYIGPIDGHDINSLVDILENIKNITDDKPIILHTVTKKGYGYKDAMMSHDSLHGVDGKINKSSNNNISNSMAFTNALITKAKQDKDIVVISAAMLKGTGLEKFEQFFPDRTFDVGIAEQHAVSFASGLAKQGLKPFVAIYSTFMQRAYDQVVHDVSLNNLPVRIVMDRAGLVGQDGETHAGVFDYTMFLPLPNIVFLVPSCREDIALMVDYMCTINDKPSFMRFSKSKLKDSCFHNDKIELGKGYIVQKQEQNTKSKKLAILSIGEILQDIIEANEMLKQDDISITIADARFAKPLDEQLIIDLAKSHDILVVAEESMGAYFSALVLEILLKHDLLNKISYHNISYPNFYISQGTPKQQKELALVDSKSIYNKIKSILS